MKTKTTETNAASIFKLGIAKEPWEIQEEFIKLMDLNEKEGWRLLQLYWRACSATIIDIAGPGAIKPLKKNLEEFVDAICYERKNKEGAE